MIAKDQPTIFSSKILAGVSSAQDGNMKKNGIAEDLRKDVDSNRKKFLSAVGIKLDQAVLVNLSYDKEDFAVYSTVSSSDNGKGIVKDGAPIADALATQAKNTALFLPIADCVGAILYDPARQALMVSHLGRHSTQQHGATKSVDYMVNQFGSNPGDILVWCSPSPGKDSYPLYVFENKSLAEVNKQHFVEAGIKPENIEISSANTAKDTNYFSHSEFLKGNREIDGRFAIVAMIK